MGEYKPISEKYPHFLHGGDYNPDQWLEYPKILDEDIRLMKLANWNVVSLGIFAWAALEPEEGNYQFEWLDRIMDKLYDNGIYVILATPSAAPPAWLVQKYPEIAKVDSNRVRHLFGGRKNYCFTSPIYREKVRNINRKLAERYKDHPALIAWHISNEYGNDCHCDLCQEAFRTWLKKKYDNDIKRLNHEWWSYFWSHTFTDWSQIQTPSPHGETTIHGLNLDYKRFVTDQTIDFFKNEIAPLKELTPNIPITTNFMGTFPGLNYWKFAKHLDVISWDSYPTWHGNEEDWVVAYKTAFVHDINRSLKGGQPFMLMESTPSVTNWQPVSKLKRPGMHVLSSIQAVAHGADTVQYFQWRKSRGGFEKFHGAVVDHCGHEKTRVFKDVKEVGEILKRLDPIIGTSVKPEVAIIYDWENSWAIEDAKGPRQEKKDYLLTCQSHYRPFWSKGVPVDVIDMENDFNRYKLLIAPMLYMLKDGVVERIKQFVKNGGTFVTTYWSGIVNENDLCYLGGFPGPLKEVLGIWSEEIDGLHDKDENCVVFNETNELGIKGEYKAKELCEIIHLEGAKDLAKYKEDFYAGYPAVTVNNYGNGKAYYIAFRNNDDFVDDFYGKIIEFLNIKRSINCDLPIGVTVQERTDGKRKFVFLLNFTHEQKVVNIKDMKFSDLLSGDMISQKITLTPYGFKILERL
ncbi:beta-galactosidase [Thermoanaerobacterium sp. RBIITD]|uniref:beta-galactosidase n=1 Tax=Thermoanaerobacterium sp. RBIITD TaxID=1550240 RepID=UPI000BB745DE|nr:beta-galactosidase [Thermoanaerobacterium sp. RBIITD]SNX53392.1 beta-galactosidase [Thermoanaerobacterium sp. RBIITD]